MSVKLGDLNLALRGVVQSKAQNWARGDNVVSKADQENRYAGGDINSRTPDYIRDAAAELRAAEAPRGRVTVNEVVDHVSKKCEGLWQEFNAPGAGGDELSPEELDRMAGNHPAMSGLLLQATQMAQENAQRGHPERVQNMAEWMNLPKEVRAGITEEGGAQNFANLRTVENVPIDKLRTGAQRAFADKMVRFLDDEVGLGECPDEYGKIGEPEITVDLVTLPSGEVAGGRIHVFQQGFDPEEIDVEDTPYYFEDAQAARAAGYDPDQDISWSLGGHFDQDANPLSHDDYWEWTGW